MTRGAGSLAVRGVAPALVAAASPLALAGVSPGFKTGRSFAFAFDAPVVALVAADGAAAPDPAASLELPAFTITAISGSLTPACLSATSPSVEVSNRVFD